VKNWTLRELLLLVTVIGFVLFHIGNTIRLKVMQLEPFEVSADELSVWAKEIDPQLSKHGGSSQTSSRLNVSSTRFQHLELETTAEKAPEIVRHWRRRVLEQIDQNGWMISGRSGENPFSFSIWKLDSLYEINFQSQSTPIPVNDWNKNPNRVVLTIHWITIGYTRLRDDKRLVTPASAAP